jgi:hypothetical protein
MMYTREFLIDCSLYKFVNCSLITLEQFESLEKMTHELYDRVGKDKFRTYCGLDADAIREYKATL